MAIDSSFRVTDVSHLRRAWPAPSQSVDLATVPPAATGEGAREMANMLEITVQRRQDYEVAQRAVRGRFTRLSRALDNLASA